MKVGPDGRFLHEVVVSGADAATVPSPADVLVDARGSVLVLDRAGSSIHAYDKNGSLLGARPLGTDLAEEGRDPRAALMLDPFARLWLIAPREGDLVRLGPALERERAGRFLTPEDSVGTPGAAVATPNGQTWIADAVTGSVRRFRSSGALAASVRGADSLGESGVVALAADPYNFVYAADERGQRILVYDADGAPVLERMLGGSAHPWRPSAIAWSFRDRIAVADAKHGEVKILAVVRAVPSALEGASSGGKP